jgi:pimeloyl-ACP methyl ester carboxylesterase
MGKRGPRGVIGVSILIIAAVLVTATVANIGRRLDEGMAERRADPAFYSLPATIAPGEPGQIIRSERIASAPLGSIAWRIIYHSRDLAGNDIPVSGIVMAPITPAPRGGRTIVSWAHPTTGAAAHCAPSLETDPFFTIEGMHELLAAGYAIAATDYPGMGVAGASSYLLGIPESNSVLDAARAARNLASLHAGSKLLLWGHSQGGQAALFAAERASDYAPELQLEGVAVAAPAANLGTLLTDDISKISGTTIASYTFASYGAAYPDADTTSILTPAGLAATPKMANYCLLSQTKQIHKLAGPLVGKYVTSNPATTEPWQTLLRENSAGNSPITVPVFIGQGLADQLVIPSATEQFVQQLCAAGTDVTFHRFGGINHGLAAYASVPSLLPWLGQVDRGVQPPSTC